MVKDKTKISFAIGVAVSATAFAKTQSVKAESYTDHKIGGDIVNTSNSSYSSSNGLEIKDSSKLDFSDTKSNFYDALSKAKKNKNVTLIQDKKQTKKSAEAIKDYNEQTKQINKQVDDLNKENQNISQENQVKEEKFQKEFSKWNAKNDKYLDSIQSKTGWTKEAVKNFFGTQLPDLTYLSIGENAPVELVLGPGIEDTGVKGSLFQKLPNFDLPLKRISKGQYITYTNAFADSKTGRSIDIRYTLVDHNGTDNQIIFLPLEKQMTIEVLNGSVTKWNLQFIDHETQEPVKLDALLAAGDVDGNQLLHVDSATKVLSGRIVVSEKDATGILAYNKVFENINGPSIPDGQAWFIVPNKDNIDIVFGAYKGAYDNFLSKKNQNSTLNDINRAISNDFIEFGIGSIEKPLLGNQPMRETMTPLKDVILHYHEIGVLGTVTAKYVSEDGTILDSDHIEGEAGTKYSVKSEDFDGYELVSEPQNASGVFTDNDIEVVYRYRRVPASVKVRYEDEEGNILDKDQITGKVGEKYETQAKSFDDYKLKTIPENASGVYGKENTDVVYVYERIAKKAKLTVIDDNLNKYLEVLDTEGKLGEKISFDEAIPNLISGYEANGYELVSNSFKGQTYQKDDADNQFEIHFKHKKQKVYESKKINETIHYVDEEGKQVFGDYHASPLRFERQGIKDMVTGEAQWEEWTRDQTFDAVDSPELSGYEADPARIDEQTVGFDSPHLEFTVVYKQTYHQGLTVRPHDEPRSPQKPELKEKAVPQIPTEKTEEDSAEKETVVKEKPQASLANTAKSKSNPTPVNMPIPAKAGSGEEQAVAEKENYILPQTGNDNSKAFSFSGLMISLASLVGLRFKKKKI